MHAVNNACNFATVTPLSVLDNDKGAARAADRARFGHVFQGLAKSNNWSQTQRTSSSKSANATVQAELGLYSSYQGGSHMNLLEITLGGEPVAVTEGFLSALKPAKAAELAASPVPREHSDTFNRLLNVDLAKRT